MNDWKPQPYRREAQRRGVSPEVLAAAIAASEAVVTVNPSLPPILSLRHLSHLTGVPYQLIRAWVTREGAGESPYKTFSIRKRPKKDGTKQFRFICVPQHDLGLTQRWIASKVLALGRPHSASTAFAPKSKLFEAVEPHCECKWLIKVDVQRFFESITEIAVYQVFRKLGYQPLVSLELARICTRLGPPGRYRPPARWRRHAPLDAHIINSYSTRALGHLPQGASTSPMLSNLVMVDLDEKLSKLASSVNMTYTRYADDFTFSSHATDFNREAAERFIKDIYHALGQFGLKANLAKTQIIPPRARKVVLGLLVDGKTPRLTRKFKAKMRMHLYYLEHAEVGPLRHAERRGFSSIAGLRNHLLGLAAYAIQIEMEYGLELKTRLEAIQWPLL